MRAILTVLIYFVFSLFVEADSFYFTVFCDNRNNDGLANILAEMNTRIGGPGAFIVAPGDIDPPSATQEKVYQQWGSNTVFYPCVGNHEIAPVNYMSWMRSKFNELPNIVNAGPVGSEATTYSWDYMNAHFIMLNQYYDGASDTGTDGDVVDALYNWLASDLAANTKPAIFVIGHEPVYPQDDVDFGAGTARHISDSLNKYSSNRDRFWQLLNEYGVIAYLHGHNHRYSATQPNGDTWQIDGAQAQGQGVDQKYDAFLKITVSDKTYRVDTWRDLNADGTFVLEHSWSDFIYKHGNWFVSSTDTGRQSIAWAENWGFSGCMPVQGDYDGDGTNDFAVFHEPTGNWYIRTLGTNVLAWAENWGFAGCEPVPGDYDGDGINDLAVYYERTGDWYIRTLAGQVLAWGLNWGFSGAESVLGDYDGDGTNDLAVYYEATGDWYIRSLDGQVLVWANNWGFYGAEPVSGDYDGDGTNDLAVFHEPTGNWYIYSWADDNIIAWAKNWGFSGCQPVLGDYDGDGTDDMAVFYEATGAWYVRKISGGAAIILGENWGFPGVMPVVGDYDGDGSSDLAIFEY